MTEPVRVGVAGLGAVAQTVHLPLLARRPDLFRIDAVADISPGTRGRVGSRYGVAEAARFATVDQLIAAPGLDAILLLTSGSHGSDVLAAVRAGLKVFCEKPLAYSQAEATALRAATADEAAVMVAYMKQYDPAATAMAGAVAAASDVRAVRVEVLHPSDASQLAFANLPPRPDDVDPAALAGLAAATDAVVRAAIGRSGDAPSRLYTNILLGSIVHDVSLLRGIFGSPTSIGSVRRYAGEPGSLEVTGLLPGDLPFTLAWHYIPDYPAYRESVTVHHSRGSAGVVFPCPYLLNAPSEVHLVDNRGGVEMRTVGRTVAEEFEIELAAFHDLVTAGAPPRSGPAQGLADIRTAQQMYAVHAATVGLEIAGEAAAW